MPRTDPDAVTYADPIVTLDHPDTGATIRYESDAYELTWTDYVANDWTETYPTLSAAVARLAMLMACAESDWRRAFASGETDVVTAAADMFAATLTD